MLGGRRKSHDYPHGKPFPLVLVNIAMLIVAVLWVIFALKSWAHAVTIVALFVALGLIDSKLHQAYERTGQAVPIAPPVAVVIKFIDRTPVSLVALRYAFFVFVAVLIVFGVAPLRDATAKTGMIGSVIGLVVIGILHFALEHYYVHTGRGKEVPRVDLSHPTAASKSPDQH
jgi:hypothetical protein